MKRVFIFITLEFILLSCKAQYEEKRKVGGPCEGCEALYEYGDQTLDAIDTLPDFINAEPKLHLYGLVFEKDGKTPAKNGNLHLPYQQKRDLRKNWK